MNADPSLMTCSVDGCSKSTSTGGKGLCGMHRARQRKGKPLGPAGFIRKPGRTVMERVRDRVITNPKSGCIEWQGATVRGYGVVGVEQAIKYVHRVTYEDKFGTIPEGLVIDHLCVNPLCCNPDHLEAVTRAENNRRGGLTTGERRAS